jgi:hypothetical protein
MINNQNMYLSKPSLKIFPFEETKTPRCPPPPLYVINQRKIHFLEDPRTPPGSPPPLPINNQPQFLSKSKDKYLLINNMCKVF